MNITKRRLLAAIAGGAMLSACATIALAPTGVYSAEREFRVTLTRPWSDLTASMLPRRPGVHMLTMDGPALNQLYVASLAPNASLYVPMGRNTPAVRYRADMSDSELVEFVVDSLATEFQEPRSTALRPQTLAGAAGVRFDINMRTASGLNMSGTGLVARSGDKLHLLLFVAPSEHYYSAFAPEVEAIFASAAPA